MKKNYFRIKEFILMLCLVTGSISFAQVGIGTATPDPSSMLDLKSNSQGLLAPRMTTLQRTAITSPAESLLVYDTDQKGFYWYNTSTSTWIKIANDISAKRNNYKLIKSAADLAQELIDGGGTRYKLNTSTYYEINGLITLAKPIDLNNAYIAGLDANEDILRYTAGAIFEGVTSGGSIKNLTLTGGRAFNITGPGIATNSSLLVQNTIIANMTNSVGSISGFGMYYAGVVQFVSNANGITYSNIGNCLLDNQAWLSSNNGTFEKFTGTFGLIQKGSGFSAVDEADIAFDVSTPGLIVGNGIIDGTVFSGTTSAPLGYVSEYAAASTYPGYNFSNAWTVNATGIPNEDDTLASGNLYFQSSVEATFTTNTPRKLVLQTNTVRLFRTAEGSGLESENRLVYTGEGRRAINVLGSLSFTGSRNAQYIFSIYKNGLKVIGSEVVANTITSDARQPVSLLCTVDVKKGDFIEVWVEKTTTGSDTFIVNSYNLILN